MKILDKIAEVFIAIGNDMKNRLIASPPTAAGQVLVSKLVDGQVVAVWDDAANLGLTGGGAPMASQLIFSDLRNCTYENDTLSYTSGNLAIFDSQGYQAVTDKPVNVSIVYNLKCFIYIGDNPTIDGYYDSNNTAEGLMIRFDYMKYRLGTLKDQETGMTCNDGDVLNFNIANSQVTITNTTTNQTWTSPPSDYLTTPAYMGVAVVGTSAAAEPLTIKALSSSTVVEPVPAPAVLSFSDLQNVSYNDKILSYDGGELPGLGGYGQAITDKPINIEYILGAREVYIFLGEYSDFNSMDSDSSKGVVISADGYYLFVDGKPRTLIQMIGEPSSSLANNGDIVRITIENNYLTFRNLSQNKVYITPTSQYLNNPKYLGIVSNVPSFTVYGVN